MKARTPQSWPDIARYPWQRRRDYLILVAAVAASDGVLHPDELALLRTWMDEFHLPPKSREAVLAVAESARLPGDRSRIERRLASTDLVYSLLLDLMGMAMADGVLMDKEVHLLRGIAENLGVDPIDFDILIEFIHSAHQASQLDNPEPLFEHNIERAFDLMHRRQVRLFPHTLLCATSPEYDKRLKERWIAYSANSNGGPARSRAAR